MQANVQMASAWHSNTLPAVKAAINKVDVDHCKEMYSNIVLVGGSSVMVGLRDRLEMAVSELAPITAQGGMRVRVAVPTAGAEVRGNEHDCSALSLSLFPDSVLSPDAFILTSVYSYSCLFIS